MIWTAAGLTGLFFMLFVLFGLTGMVSGTWKTVLSVVFLVLTVIGLGITVWMILLYRAFSYDGKRQMSKQIIEGVAEYVHLPDGGKGLDIKTPTLIQFNDLPVAYLQAG